MNILRVIETMNPATGGPCQGIRNMIPELANLGCRNEVVCLDDPDAVFLGEDPFPIHALGKGITAAGFHSALLPWLRKNLPRFDAVILHGLWKWCGLAVWIACREDSTHRPAVPYFVMPHGMLDPWFQKAPERRMKALRNRIYWRLFESRVIRDAAAVLFTCEGELESARRTFGGYTPRREINVGYGIPEPPPFCEQMMGTFLSQCLGGGDDPYLLFLGRIHPKKGLDLLIRAYSRHLAVHRDHISQPPLPRLVIAGPGLGTPFGRKIEQLVQTSCPPGSIHFTGMLEGEAKSAALHGCEAFILPSHQENFGIAVVEALACSKPVLISNQVNIHSRISEAGAGLVAGDDLAGVEDLLAGWLALGAKERGTMGAAASDLFKREFSSPQAAVRMITTITSLLAP